MHDFREDLSRRPREHAAFLHEGGQFHVYCLAEADNAKRRFGGENERKILGGSTCAVGAYPEQF
jgi:hypothetical protein